METKLRSVITAMLLCSAILSVSCAAGGGLTGNEAGSEPVNEKEGLEYKKAIVRCYKTGGSRVVKIMGELRCY